MYSSNVTGSGHAGSGASVIVGGIGSQFAGQTTGSLPATGLLGTDPTLPLAFIVLALAVYFLVIK